MLTLPAHGQRTPEVGDWVRVRIRQSGILPSKVEGKLSDISHSGLSVVADTRFGHQQLVEFPWQDIRRFEVRVERGRSFVGAGALTGLVLGALIPGSMAIECIDISDPCPRGRSISGGIVLAGMAAGAVAGGWAGSRIHRTRWRRIPLTVRFQYR